MQGCRFACTQSSNDTLLAAGLARTSLAELRSTAGFGSTHHTSPNTHIAQRRHACRNGVCDFPAIIGPDALIARRHEPVLKD